MPLVGRICDKTIYSDGDSQAIWSKLTAQERDEFMKLVKEERLSELIKQWIPWWSYKVVLVHP